MKTNTGDPSFTKVVLIDGHCNLCVGLVRFIFTKERNQELKFANIQDSVGAELMLKHGLKPGDLSSIVVIAGERAYRHSDAVIQIAEEFRAPYSWLRFLRFSPKFIRDFGYRLVANNRYRLFGKRDTCYLPEGGLANRFLK